MAQTMTERQEKVFAKAQQIFSEQLGRREDAIKLESEIFTDLGCDELDALELVMEFEDSFDVSISDEVALAFVTVQDIVTWLDENNGSV